MNTTQKHAVRRHGSAPQPVTATAAVTATRPGQVVLVLQGGGALGSYQAGVYQAMQEAGMEPDWVIGTSIGAINAALIAGNPPALRLQRLHAFWRSLEQTAGVGLCAYGAPALATALSDWATVAAGIPAFFIPNPLAWLGQQARVGVERAAYYRATPLRHTLETLVDLDYINARHVRLALGAVKVATGQMCYFDSRQEPLSVDHILASAALPPAFPAVRVKDDFYWDGGIYSNTPIEAVLEDNPRRDSLIFCVDLWSATGPLPQSLWQVQGKEKDIRYASRSDSQIARHKQLHHLRHVIEQLTQALPQATRTRPEVAKLAAGGCNTTMHIVRIVAPNAASENPLMDIDFTPRNIQTRWQAGYGDVQALMERAPWEAPVEPGQGVYIHQARAAVSPCP
jgi:NTE family protein